MLRPVFDDLGLSHRRVEHEFVEMIVMDEEAAPKNKSQSNHKTDHTNSTIDLANQRGVEGHASRGLFRNAVLFALGAEHAVNRIGRPASRLVIVPHLHFAQQTNRQHVEASQQQHGCEQHQRAVLRHDF